MKKIFFLGVLILLIVPAQMARAEGPSAIDRRVSAIPAATLLSRPPAQLVDQNRQAAAQQLTRLTRPAWFVSVFLEIAILLYLWRSGWAARVRDRLRLMMPWAFPVRFVFGAFLVGAVTAATLLPSFYDYRVLRIMGLSTESFGNWIRDVMIATALEALVVGVCVAVVLWLVDRTHWWWAWVVAGIFGVTFFLSYLYPIVVEPLFNHFAPLPRTGDLSIRIRALARRAGEGELPIYVSDLSRRTKAGNAYVVGIGPSKRIVIGDTLLSSATPDEIVFVVAHELGHDVHRDTFKGSIFASVMFIFAAALAVLMADRLGFRRDDDPLSRIALVAALLAVLYVVLLPVTNGYSRIVESAADAYGLHLTADKVAGARTFVRFADEDLALLCPGRLARIWWYSHPPLGTRISVMNGQANPCP